MNKVILLGNVGNMPTEIKNGSRFSLATSKKQKTITGGYENKTTWHNILIFGKINEHLSQYIKKGIKIMVEGEISNLEYIDKNGEKKLTSSIIASHIYFCEKLNIENINMSSKKVDDDFVDDIPF